MRMGGSPLLGWREKTVASIAASSRCRAKGRRLPPTSNRELLPCAAAH